MHFLLIIGCMFSGKTTMLLQKFVDYRKKGQKCVLIKHTKDDRYMKNAVCTHDRSFNHAHICSTKEQIEKLAEGHDIIFIDEGHFFPDIAQIIDELLKQNKTVLVAGLHAESPTKGFPHMMNLLSRADEIEHLQATCDYCPKPGSFTLRVIPIPPNGNMIGGKDAYRACCRSCYNENVKKFENYN